MLSTLATVRIDIAQIVDIVVHIVCNRPKREKTPGESRYALLFIKKGGKRYLFRQNSCHQTIDPALPSFEEINKEQNNLSSLPDLNQVRDTSTLDKDEETDGMYISDENDD